MTATEEQLHLRVAGDKIPERLDVFVTRSVRGVSRSQIKRLIDQKRILVDGVAAKAGHLVAPHECIDITYPVFQPMNAEPEDLPLDILYEDSDLVIVNKPAGIIIHPSPNTPRGTVVNALTYHVGSLSGENGPMRPGIVHRLDKGTTGVLVVAKTDQAHRSLSDQFMFRRTRKVYWAFVCGRMRLPEGTIDRPLSRGRKDIRRVVISPHGKQSVTDYKVLKQYQVATLVEVYPRTGRTHQIRAHLASIGYPCFGDPLYGGRNHHSTTKSRAERALIDGLLPIVQRQALHARGLGFSHPDDGRWCYFEAPLPADMQELWRCLEEAHSDLEGTLDRLQAPER